MLPSHSPMFTAATSYRNVYFHKRTLHSLCLSHVFICWLETKNTWARDDPAILILIAGCLCGTSQLIIPSSSIVQAGHSISHSMVRGILIFATTSREASTLYDSARFSASWSRHSDNPLVCHDHVFSHIIYKPSESHRFFSNRMLLSPPSHSAPSDSRVEWAYAFDVHTNAFFPFYLTLYLAQLILVPIILKSNWICLFVSNTLYLAA